MHDAVLTPGLVPWVYSMHPHPAVDAAPLSVEAHLAAQAAAGYVHPDGRARMKQDTRLEWEAAEAPTGVKEETAAAEVATFVAGRDAGGRRGRSGGGELFNV